MKESDTHFMELQFVKLNGLGNDFVFIDDFSQEIDLTADQVKWLCDRHFGIGADGVILVRPSADADCVAYMHYINSDGTLAQMCGNGVRCFAKYLVDRGFVSACDSMFIADTMAGQKPIHFQVDEDEKLISATVDMGHPMLSPAAVPVEIEANANSAQGVAFVREAPIDSPWGTFHFTCVSMGNPHAVCFIDDISSLPDGLFLQASDKSLATFDVSLVGAFFEKHPLFPEKTNVEFATVMEPGIVSMRVYERGCGETLACGTGACATSVAATLTGRSGCENDIRLLGGCLHIAWDDDDHVLMTGPAEESFSGSVTMR